MSEPLYVQYKNKAQTNQNTSRNFENQNNCNAHTRPHTLDHRHKNEDLALTSSKINKRYVWPCFTNSHQHFLTMLRKLLMAVVVFFVARLGPRSFLKVGICFKFKTHIQFSRFFFSKDL